MVDVKWTRTWPDSPNDYTAFDTETGERVGSIYISPTAPEAGKWSWFFGGGGGRADTAQEAADEIRRQWKEACERDPGLQQAKQPAED